jgi:predicted kinase
VASANVLDLLCGLPFAGKSRLAGQLARELGATVVSLDEINARRGLAGGLGMPVEEWRRSHEIALGEVAAACARGGPVVVDDTLCHRFLRDAFRRVAAPYGYASRVLWIDLGLEEALRRARRNRRSPLRPDVRDEVLVELAGRFEPPAADEPTVRVPAAGDLAGWVRRRLRTAERPVERERS